MFQVNFLAFISNSVDSESDIINCFGICFVTSTSVKTTFETFSTSKLIDESHDVLSTIDDVESCCLDGFVSMFSLRTSILGPLDV